MYKYKVIGFAAEVLESDVQKGLAVGKIREQLEVQLEEHANDEWEFVGQYRFGFTVKQGCSPSLSSLFTLGLLGGGGGPTEGSVYQLVFRKQI